MDLPADKIVGLLPGSVCERKSQIDLVHALKLLDAEIVKKLEVEKEKDKP